MRIDVLFKPVLKIIWVQSSLLINLLKRYTAIDFVFLQVNIAKRSFLEIARQAAWWNFKDISEIGFKIYFDNGKGSFFIEWNCWILIWLF